MITARRLRAIIPPPPNRPLPPIPTAEEEAAAAALQHRRLSMSTTTTTATVNTAVLNSKTKASQNRRVVPRMGTRSHPRGSRPSTFAVCDVNEQVTVSRLSASSPSSSSSSSSSGCEDATIESRQRSADDYIKITSQPCLINLETGYQDSDDGYTSLNALDSLKYPHRHHHRHCQQPSWNPNQMKKTCKLQESKRPHSIASSITSSSSFDDESTLVCRNDRNPDLPLDGMYRLKVKSTTSTTAPIQFHGNKRLTEAWGRRWMQFPLSFGYNAGCLSNGGHDEDDDEEEEEAKERCIFAIQNIARTCKKGFGDGGRNLALASSSSY
ncbi:hypothetical protein TcWFU_005052 [Taenia crassiceps]|uniref:Uncharacterized protein n=1 Tax=Taenia crassiceps TaxID=6207 RepID=A0ABR4QBH1_9CEST